LVGVPENQWPWGRWDDDETGVDGGRRKSTTASPLLFYFLSGILVRSA
jgi:hypothetical protein